MRRFIDVIFVDPKIKRYVVLHQGEFWQLPRLNLSVNSWALKQPYAGELSDIFVAKEQGVACAELSQTLKTYDLPPQLHGQSAIGFLGWWQTNDYKWLSTQNVLTLNADSTDDKPLPSTQMSVVTESADKQQMAHSQSVATEQAPTHQDIVSKPITNPVADLTTKSHEPHKPNPASPTQSKTTTTETQNTQASKESADGLDIFDNLLNELTEEILHPH